MRPSTAITVTLDNGEVITIAAGDTSGSVDVTVASDEDAIALIRARISAAISSTSGGNFENVAIDTYGCDHFDCRYDRYHDSKH